MSDPTAQSPGGGDNDRTPSGDATTSRPLLGRRALVTGGASGIGRATVRRLAADGAAVLIDFVGDAAPADALAAEIVAAGGRALAVRADVSDERQVAALFERATAELGPIDLPVNNAGREKPFALVDMPLEEWNAVLGLNLTRAVLAFAGNGPRGLAVGAPGVIVNVSSVHEVIPRPQFSHYCASKAGLKLFARRPLASSRRAAYAS